MIRNYFNLIVIKHKVTVTKIKQKENMKYIKTLVVTGVLFAAVLATAVSAAPSTNAPLAQPTAWTPWSLSLSGAGSSALSDATVNNSTVGGQFQLGRDVKVVFPAEIGLRQGISYSDVNSSTWLLSSKVYSDWRIIRVGNFEIDAGGNIGIQYGNQPLKWQATPEVVARVYLKKDVDVFARVEYPFDLTNGRAEERLDYTLGVRFHF